MPDAIEWRAVERRVLRARRAAPVRHAARPAALQAALAARARAHGRGGARAPALRRRPGAVRADHRARLDRAADGPRRRGRRCGGRCCAASSASAPTRSRWSGCGASCGCAARSRARTCEQERLGYPRDILGAAVRGARALDRGRRRPGPDRPPGRAGRPRRRRPGVHAGRARLVPRRPRPARVRRGGAASTTTACSPPSPTTYSSSCSTRRSPPRWGRPTSRGRAASSTSPRSACCSSSTAAFSPYYWTNVADRALPFVGADRAHELHRARALRRPPLPLRRQLPAARPRAARARRRRAARPLRGRPARGQPGVRRALGRGARWRFTPSRPRSRSSPSATPTGSRRCARRPPGSCSPTRRRSIPRTAARTTPCGSATQAARGAAQRTVMVCFMSGWIEQ